MQIPVWCACGRIVTYPGETRCEDCWAADQQRYHGYSRAVQTHDPVTVEEVNMFPFIPRCGQLFAPLAMAATLPVTALSPARREPDRQPG